MKEKAGYFYIIFDEQTSSKESRIFSPVQQFNIGSFAAQSIVFVSDSASSAYYYTAVALASVFRGSPFKENKTKNRRDGGLPDGFIQPGNKNQFIPYLKENGYEIINTAEVQNCITMKK